MAETHVVGQPLPRIDAAAKVRGQAIFAADAQLPRMLIGKFLPSPHAHAEILAIDTSRAEALPGVRAVITAADIPEVDTYDPGSRFHAFLARRFAVFAGQPIAAVAAADLATAEAALELIQVEYRLLPVVIDPRAGILPESTAVSRESRPGDGDAAEKKESPNIASQFVFEHGDMAAAFAESDIIVEHTYTIPSLHQGYIEPHAVTAFWDRTDHVTVWECTQSPFGARDLIANTLGISATHITLNTTEVGGGFGGKDLGLFAPLAVLLAQKAQQPVKLVLTRHEELLGANPAPHTVVRLKTGAKQDGTLTALEGQALVDIGAFPTYWDAADSIPWMALANYKFESWRVEGLAVLTNRASIGSYRAPLAVNAAFAIESQLDEIAGRLGCDPLALRLQNVVLEGDLLPSLRPQGPVGAKQVLTTLAEHPAWTDPLPSRQSEDGLLHGRGLALGSWGSGTWPASVIAKLEADGKIQFVLGTVDLSGSYTSLAQIAAEALGVSARQIVMSKAGTELATYAPVSGGSGTIYSMGAAVQEAALDLRAKLLLRAAQELQVTEAELGVNDQGVFVTAKPEQALPFQKLYELGTDIFLAKYPPLVGQASVRPFTPAPCFAASVAEVAVDPETGQVFLTRLTTAQDVGKAINPLSVEGQIQGAGVQSVGMALWEEIMYDKDGEVRNPTLLDYRMPTAADVPMIETILVEAPGGDGPYGAKGVGEPPIIPPVAAVANAVTAALGTRICGLPITPERVWRALNKGLTGF
jgi:CO/xanthine dehydrogenase Mo-binding subunit